MVNLVNIDGVWLKKQGLTELLDKIITEEVGAENIITKSNGKEYITPEGIKKFKDNLHKHERDAEKDAKYQPEIDKLVVEEPKGDEALCFATILKNPGITRQEIFQILGRDKFNPRGLPKNTIKTSLWRLEKEKELIELKPDRLGNRLGNEGYWSTDKQDYANIEIGEIDKQTVLHLRKKGRPIPEIAKRLNLSEGYVHKILERRKKVGGRPKKEIDKEKILQMRKEGKSIREIAKELNVSGGFVHKILKEHNKKE